MQRTFRPSFPPWRTLPLCFFCSWCAGCSEPNEAPPSHTAAPVQPAATASFATEAQQALAPFKKQLMGTLRKAMEEQGLAGALDACHGQAQTITASAQSPTFRVGRSSPRLRNPANAAPDWLVPVMSEYASLPPSQRAPREMQIDDARRAYIEPIHMNALCLHCHGQAISADLKRSLEEKYPADQATGYADGDFRGVFWALKTSP